VEARYTAGVEAVGVEVAVGAAEGGTGMTVEAVVWDRRFLTTGRCPRQTGYPDGRTTLSRSSRYCRMRI
jgi:hypothetical protein